MPTSLSLLNYLCMVEDDLKLFCNVKKLLSIICKYRSSKIKDKSADREDAWMDYTFGSVCILRCVFPSNSWLDRLENYILGAQKYNKSNLHVFLLYINAII